jgi:hypothetical protein
VGQQDAYGKNEQDASTSSATVLLQSDQLPKSGRAQTSRRVRRRTPGGTAGDPGRRCRADRDQPPTGDIFTWTGCRKTVCWLSITPARPAEPVVPGLVDRSLPPRQHEFAARLLVRAITEAPTDAVAGSLATGYREGRRIGELRRPSGRRSAKRRRSSERSTMPATNH